MAKKFLTSVADAYGYDDQDNLVFAAKTLLDSSLEMTLGSAPVRGGRGNKLQYIYYHTPEVNVNLTETQWNLQMLGATVGNTPSGGYSYYKEETVEMTSSTGAVSDTPLSFSGTTIYGWATSPSGVTERVVFTGKNFTVNTAQAGKWCIRYYTQNLSAGDGVTISGNIIPKTVKLVLEAQLNSSESSTNKIGITQIIIPKLQLSGGFTISMTADGVSQTPLTGQALESVESAGVGCDEGKSYYAKIVEVIDNSNWYDNVIGLTIEGGDVSVAESSPAFPLTVWAVPASGGAFRVSNSVITFSVVSGTSATVGANTGIVTPSATAGDTVIKALITDKSTVEANIVVTVTN